MASSVAAVNQTSGDNSSDNDGSPLRSPPALTEAQRGMVVVMECIVLTEKDIPGATVKTSLKKAEIIQR